MTARAPAGFAARKAFRRRKCLGLPTHPHPVTLATMSETTKRIVVALLVVALIGSFALTALPALL